VRITEVAKQLAILPDEIRWFETKGYIKPKWVVLKNRRVRDYSKKEMRKIELIVKYRRQGFEHDMAFQKAMEEMENPRLVS
jgi:DNA-binding transcriptional MerR regulator